MYSKSRTYTDTQFIVRNPIAPYRETPEDFYSLFILLFSNNKLLYNGILLKVVVTDCGLSVPECACSTAYSVCKDGPLHLLGLIADVLYNTLRNNQWCSVWLSCLAADLSWQGKQSWMKHFDEAKKNPWWRLSSAPIPISQGVCPLSLGWNCRVTLRPRAWRGGCREPPSPSPPTGYVSVGYAVIWATTWSLVTHLFRLW